MRQSQVDRLVGMLVALTASIALVYVQHRILYSITGRRSEKDKRRKPHKVTDYGDAYFQARWGSMGHRLELVRHEGRCLCGRFSFGLSAPAHLKAFDCPGRLRYPHVFVPVAAFQALSDLERLTLYSARITEMHQTVVHAFCSSCGVPIFRASNGAIDTIIVNVDCLAARSIKSLEVTFYEDLLGFPPEASGAYAPSKADCVFQADSAECQASCSHFPSSPGGPIPAGCNPRSAADPTTHACGRRRNTTSTTEVMNGAAGEDDSEEEHQYFQALSLQQNGVSSRSEDQGGLTQVAISNRGREEENGDLQVWKAWENMSKCRGRRSEDEEANEGERLAISKSLLRSRLEAVTTPSMHQLRYHLKHYIRRRNRGRPTTEVDSADEKEIWQKEHIHSEDFGGKSVQEPRQRQQEPAPSFPGGVTNVDLKISGHGDEDGNAEATTSSLSPSSAGSGRNILEEVGHKATEPSV